MRKRRHVAELLSAGLEDISRPLLIEKQLHTLCDGSVVYNVHIDDYTLRAYSKKDADRLIAGLLELIERHTMDETMEGLCETRD